LKLSERRICRVLGQHRSTQRRVPTGPDDEERLTADIVELARRHGRLGYRKIAEMLRSTAGWIVNDKRVERIWRREGLKVPAKQSKQGRIWFADGSCIRLRAERPNHVWSYDFVEDRTHDGRKYRMLNLIDEFTHECLAIRVDRKLKSADVIDVLSDQFVLRGVPEHIRSDNGPEFVAKAVRDWIGAVGVKTAYIERGSPWENGFIESFNARLRDELLDGEIFYSLAEARIVIESWRRHYNTERPHGSLGYKPPAPEVFIPAFAARAGSATPTSAAARASREANHQLTFALDQSLGADQERRAVIKAKREAEHQEQLAAEIERTKSEPQRSKDLF
jgi:putative transposase